MRTKYFIDDKRDFANEYQVLAADTPERLTRLERYIDELPASRLSPRVRPISYKDARRLAISIPAYYDRVQQQHFITMSVPSTAALDFDLSRSDQFARLPMYTEQYFAEIEAAAEPVAADEFADFDATFPIPAPDPMKFGEMCHEQPFTRADYDAAYPATV